MSASRRKVKLKDVCREITVGHVGPMATEYVPDGIPFLRSQNVRPFKFDSSGLQFITPTFHSKLRKSVLFPGDVVVTRSGANTGQCCVVPHHLREANCADLVVIRPSKDADSWFLMYLINSAWGRATIAGSVVGAAQHHFNIGVAKEMLDNLPAIEIQRRIPSILTAYDELIENNRRRIEILEEMARRLYREAMMICIDKATAVKMHDKVRKHWQAAIAVRQQELATLSGAKTDQLRDEIAFLEETDIAVVVSQAQNEVDDMKLKGLDIKPHRKQMVEEDMEAKFKEPDDPFRLVFVCAMWITGFDVPNISTIYMDKPLRSHTLMQTIARANRVFPDKECGTIVDYVGVFKNLNKALAIYGDPTGRSTTGSDDGGGDHPANLNEALVERLRIAIADTAAFCAGKGFDLVKIPEAQGFQRVALLEDAVEQIIVNDESKKEF